jgi:hypothetical protein
VVRLHMCDVSVCDVKIACVSDGGFPSPEFGFSCLEQRRGLVVVQFACIAREREREHHFQGVRGEIDPLGGVWIRFTGLLIARVGDG